MHTYKDLTGTYGDVPKTDVQQLYSDTCAIKSQQLILKDFGINITEDQLVQYSIDNGWYNNDGNGTMMGDVGKLLVAAQIPTTQMDNANIYDLANQLAQGHKVIVGVDSGELWDDSFTAWFKGLFDTNDTPDHALIVAGLDMSDPNNPSVILTDPGTGEAAKPYPLDQFMDAWKDSNNFMVSTNIPTQGAVQSFQNLNYNDYHLPSIANINYDDFTIFNDYSHILPTLDYTGIHGQYLDLYNAFGMMSTQNMSFFDAIHHAGLPYYDVGLFDTQLFNPLPINMGNDYAYDYSQQNAINSLQDNYEDCMRYADQAMKDGLAVTAQLFINQANDIQQSIDNITYNI